MQVLLHEDQTRSSGIREKVTSYQGTKKASILIISEETALMQVMRQSLSREGYQVDVSHSIMDGLLLAHQKQPDLVLLDYKVSSVSKLEICKRFKTLMQSLMLIVLLEGDDVNTRISALNYGADDCLSKPFFLQEMIARIKARLRARETRLDDVLRFDDLTLNRKSREVYRGNKAIELTRKEFDLLDYLMANHRQVLTRSQILETVWGYDYMGESNVIEVYIRYLRNKLEATNPKRLIHTVRSVGYVFREAA